MKRGDLIVVWWVDTATHYGDQPNPEGLVGFLAKTSGFFYNQDEKYIRVYHTGYGVQGQSDVTVIPNDVVLRKPKVYATGDEFDGLD